ncbi:MAG: hypothetical protein PVS3B3_13210 [Ktedonobacteraceae bacterium]
MYRFEGNDLRVREFLREEKRKISYIGTNIHKGARAFEVALGEQKLVPRKNTLVVGEAQWRLIINLPSTQFHRALGKLEFPEFDDVQ